MLATLLAGLASGETVRAVQRLRSALIMWSLAGLFGLVGVGFLVGAAYLATAREVGSLYASLIFGAAFILLALLVLLIHRLGARSRNRAYANKRSTDLTAVGTAAAVAALPTLLSRRGGLFTLIAPALGAAAYAIYKENRRTRRRPIQDRDYDYD